MRELKFETKPKPLTVRLWTLKDKDSYFRAKEPDVYIIEFKLGNTVIREIESTDRVASVANYKRIKAMLKR